MKTETDTFSPTEGNGAPVTTGPSPDYGKKSDVEKPKPKGFHGTVELNVHKMATDAGKVSTEVVQHLAAILGADVKITLDIEAHIPGGVDDSIIRTVSENCRTLKFKNSSFENE
ncbi:hypothetical protein QQ056_17155 [Oscillatoria laete-virens NRMC-F 0139]|nr:hypothetical protein [Oscillatoria laete-virens]MDL5055261.1 hypothetical protein [Oscillatoria laete-virens NRMC-F 0139]